MPVSANEALIEPTNNLELVEIDSEITPMTATRKSFSDSGRITKWQPSLGFVHTDYVLGFDVDSNYTNRTYIDYSGYFLNWYSVRYLSYDMKSQVSLNFINRTSRSTYKSISSWPARSKYDYIGQGGSWVGQDGGNYSYFYSAVGSRTNIESVVGFICSKDLGIIDCGLDKNLHNLD